ncbi:MAG TPA: ABC transporter permease [Patescibacteria group bacterium]|nr:ABC transporter permease [Patescibacteria group bacterium]
MNDLRFALRQLLKNPGYTIVAVLTLALGIGANTALFSVVKGVLLRPLPYRDSERLLSLWESAPGIEQEAVSPPNLAEWQAQNRSFEEIAFWTGPNDFNLVTPDGTEKVRASYPSSSLFHVLRIEPQLGRAFLPEEDRPRGPQSAIISYKLWQERFGGDPQVISRPITVDSYGRRTYSIIGVMPPTFQFPEDTDLWLAAGWNGLPQDRRSGHWLNALGRLKSGVTLEQARRDMNGIQARIARQNPGERIGVGASVVPLLRQIVGRNNRTALLVLWGVVGAVLLIACANVANLMLVRAAARQKEMALRLALGAGRWRVMRHLLTESLLLGLLGGAAGALLGCWAVKLFIAAAPGNIPRMLQVSVDGVALGFTLCAALFTAVVFGLAPAWQASRTGLDEALKEGSRTSSGVSSGRTRSSLVIAEVALATVLLVGAGLMLQSFAKLLTTDRGFHAVHVITADLDFSVTGFSTWVEATDTRPQVPLKELLEQLRQSPGVQSAGVAYHFLRRNNMPPVNWPFAIFGRTPARQEQWPTAENNAVSPGYFRSLGVPLLRGRDFMESDALDSPGVALVNESFVRRFFPHEDPLGHYITGVSNPGPLGSKDVHGVPVWYEIVGVVGDVKSLSAQPQSIPEIYRSYWQWPMQSPALFVRATGDTAAVVAAIRRETKAVIPNLPPPRIRLLADEVNDSVAQSRFQAGLLTLFGALALLLAACGIYGVLACTVTQRQREIGVRMALGAQRRDVLSLVLSQGFKLVSLGAGLGLALALALVRIIRTLLYGVEPTDPLTFAGATLLLAAVALLACWLPARRAASVHPMEALRYE